MPVAGSIDRPAGSPPDIDQVGAPIRPSTTGAAIVKGLLTRAAGTDGAEILRPLAMLMVVGAEVAVAPSNRSTTVNVTPGYDAIPPTSPKREPLE